MTMIGAALLWVGWFGFNAGSALEATGASAGIAMINTFVATAAAAMSWMFAEWLVKGKPSLLGALSGAIAGLVAVTPPAAGYAGPMGAIVLGLIAGVVCLFFCTTIKNMLGYDDALDVFGIHCVGGIVGAILTGVLVNPVLGGAGIMDYAAAGGPKIADYEFGTQVINQIKAVLLTLVWSGGRLLHPLQGGGQILRPAGLGRAGARRPRSHRSRRARLQSVVDAHAIRLGRIPGTALAVEGPWRNPGPLTFLGMRALSLPGPADLSCRRSSETLARLPSSGV